MLKQKGTKMPTRAKKLRRLINRKCRIYKSIFGHWGMVIDVAEDIISTAIIDALREMKARGWKTKYLKNKELAKRERR
jgi:hypothetical protein